MKTAKLLAVALVTFTSLPLLAQQADATAQQSTDAQAAGANVNQSTNANGKAGLKGAQINGAAKGSASAKGAGSTNGTASATGTAASKGSGSAQGKAAATGAATSKGSRSATSSAMATGTAESRGLGSTQGAAGATGTATSNGMNGVAGAVTETASSPAEMSSVSGQLASKLDSKTAKAGDQVVLKTDRTVKTADGTVIPKGTRLIGHVTSVQAHRSGSPDSNLGIQFDRAQLKSGQSFPIHSEIRSIEPPASAISSASMESEDAFDGGMMGGGGRATGSTRMAGGGGGLLSGGSQSALHHSTSAAGGIGSELGGTVNEAARGSDRMSGNAVSGLHGSASSGAGATSALTAHSTGLRGVMLSGDASGRAAGMLSASKQNIHLDSGTQMVLGVAAAK